MTAFYRIPQWWKVLHLASLTSVGICTVLLITPAAYHRIVEQGEDSEMLHQVTARLLLWAMMFLGLGICGDFYLACRMAGLGNAVSTAIAAALLAFFYGAWFGYTFWKKHRIPDATLTESQREEHKVA
jgi:membrane associated rhomboid family serine protease